MAIRDIRRQLPFSPQTDLNAFEVPEYKRYPLAPSDENGKHYQDEFGNLLVLNSKEEEDDFRTRHPEAREVLDPEDHVNELQRLRDENARLKAEQKEPESLQTDEGAAALLKQASDKPGKLKLGSKLD